MPRKKASPESSISQHLREQFRRAREERGVSQAELGRRVDKTGSAIGDIERGRVRVTVDELAELAEHLEKPVTYFFAPYVPGAEDHDLSSREIELLLNFREIRSEVLARVAFDLVENIADKAIRIELETMRREFHQEPQARQSSDSKDER
jgi:transcriptional regulator with XRE-family HTH domain